MADIDDLDRLGTAVNDLRVEDNQVWDHVTSLTPRERAALRYTDQLTTTKTVDATVLGLVHSLFSDPEVVELAMLVGMINMLNILNNALDTSYNGELSGLPV